MAPKALNALLEHWRGGGAPRGEAGESLACRYLESLGWRILARNFRCRSGELDIVGLDDGTTVFVEVKERSDPAHGQGFEAVSFGKRRRVIRAARLFAAARGLLESRLRFDVISIDRSGAAPQIRHDRGAFDADGN